MKWEDTLNILITLLKQNSGLKADRIVSTEGIPIASGLPEGVDKTKITISYFHRKIGPIVFYSYPKNSVDKDLSVKIANIMDQQFNEGFFTHSFENLKSINYYFEIHSHWARGNKEALMVSTVFNHQIKPEIEEKISDLYIEFSERLQSNEEIYTAFYINDLNYHENERRIILMNETLVKAWLNNLYWAIIENTREKTEEEKIAILMNDRHIFEALERLSKGPVPFKWLREWFFENYTNKDFKEIIDTLVDKQFIFINQIGLEEKYVHLLKEVNAERIPPDSRMVYIDDKPELIELLLPKVQDYYSEYEKKSDEELKEDTFTLFQIMADPKKYNVLSQLRKSLILKDKLPKLVPKKSLDSLMEAIEFLKKYDVIEELNYNNETYIVLKTNLQITTALLDWIVKSMRIDPENAVSAVMHSNPNIAAAAVIKGTQIIYTTDNWDISGDVDKFSSSWFRQNARFIMISGVKYSIVQMEAERLVAMFPEGEEGIVAIKGDEYILIILYKISRCENCNDPLLGDNPQIDGEIFKLCPKCFNILQGVVQEIYDVFDDD